MSKVLKCEPIESAVMSATVDGGYVERGYTGNAWKCAGCGRVWEKRWHSESCEQRGHVDRFKQEYFAGPVINGVARRTGVYWRVCIRREPV